MSRGQSRVVTLPEQELDLMICKGLEGRWHIQFDMNENKTVGDGHTVWSVQWVVLLVVYNFKIRISKHFLVDLQFLGKKV